MDKVITPLCLIIALMSTSIAQAANKAWETPSGDVIFTVPDTYSVSESGSNMTSIFTNFGFIGIFERQRFFNTVRAECINIVNHTNPEDGFTYGRVSTTRSSVRGFNCSYENTLSNSDGSTTRCVNHVRIFTEKAYVVGACSNAEWSRSSWSSNKKKFEKIISTFRFPNDE